MKYKIIYTAMWVGTLLSGCMTVGPDYRRPAIETSNVWPGETSTASVPSQWWREYNDLELDAMIEEALAHNEELKLAIARVDEARAVLGIARADQFPGLSANAAGSQNRTSQKTGLGAPPGADPVYGNVRATLNASYEIDFWGKYRRASEAARAILLSTQFSREAVRLTLIGDLSRSYFNMRALDAQIAVARRAISTRFESLDLQRKRFDAGVVSELDLRQVEAEAAAVQTLLPSLENRLAQQETAILVLLGRSPRAILSAAPGRGASIDRLAVPPAVPAGLPSDLLERRPDLRQAEEELIASNARIGQARAAFFPSISLTGFLGGESTILADLFTAPAGIWMASASAAQGIFEAGRTVSQVSAAQAREQQALARYQAGIQNAFRDTLNALVAQRKAKETLEANQTRVTALTRALTLARLRYDSGVASLLDLLDVERGLLDAELNRIEAQRAQLAATVDLYKALGGGWKSDTIR